MNEVLESQLFDFLAQGVQTLDSTIHQTNRNFENQLIRAENRYLFDFSSGCNGAV